MLTSPGHHQGQNNIMTDPEIQPAQQEAGEDKKAEVKKEAVKEVELPQDGSGCYQWGYLV